MHRKPTETELELIKYLVNKAGSHSCHIDWDSMQVASMNDGGMGSLKLYPSGNVCDTDNRTFGSELADCSFDDEDGTKVIATIYLDKSDGLFELDMWKVDYSALLRIPKSFE